MSPKSSITVLVVDNSPMLRATVSRILGQTPDINVVGDAKDAFEARSLIIDTKPDVIVLSSDLPRIDGLAFLKKLMEYYPVPVIICCASEHAAGQTALKAIKLGATDVVMKPVGRRPGEMHNFGLGLVEKVRAAAQAIRRSPTIPPNVISQPIPYAQLGINPARHLVAIGASTGGTTAITTLLGRLPADFPPIVIVQHMPRAFTKGFAGSLNQACRLHVTEAKDGDVAQPGRAFVARGGTQMRVTQDARGCCHIRVGNNELVNGHCPSADVLFDSVAKTVGDLAVGILLTGMGADGAKGLLRMRQAGAVTIAQDRRTSVVYGMPKVAAEIGAAKYVQPLTQIPYAVLRALRRRGRSAQTCSSIADSTKV